jgi:hypothetical protein
MTTGSDDFRYFDGDDDRSAPGGPDSIGGAAL